MPLIFDILFISILLFLILLFSKKLKIISFKLRLNQKRVFEDENELLEINSKSIVFYGCIKNAKI